MLVPIVDFSVYAVGKEQPTDEMLSDVAEKMRAAFCDIGFLYLQNTGIEQHEVNQALEVSRKFFLQPTEFKMLFARGSFPERYNHGWISSEGESLNPKRPGDLKEAFNVSILHPDLKWPSDEAVVGFHEVLESFFQKCVDLSLRVMTVMARSLGLPSDFFSTKHQCFGANNNSSTLRSLYYPPVDPSDVKLNQVRCGEHSDYGTITLLFQDGVTTGLEVMTRAGDYVPVPSIPGHVLLNLGDLLQMWTSDLFVSSKHRVPLPTVEMMRGTRQSIAFFVQPDNDVMVSCLDGTNKYPPVNALQYLEDRFATSYK
ncbi:proline hydroxylase buaE [Polypterus senegalus]|uniref:proline hydroxylase buaE n=1 Tax=Polypterus senegalus TaxID=55291 RepID=UPI0019659441|nr:proline hydroxylase buaE [Polypterus senegalus]